MDPYSPTAIFASKKCGKCRKVLPCEQFCRRNNLWKSCNDCSARDTAKRRNQTRAAEQSRQEQFTKEVANWATILGLHQDYQLRPEQHAYAEELRAYEEEQQRLFPQTGMEFLFSDDYDDDTENVVLSPLQQYGMQLHNASIDSHVAGDAWATSYGGVVQGESIPQDMYFDYSQIDWSDQSLYNPAESSEVCAIPSQDDEMDIDMPRGESAEFDNIVGVTPQENAFSEWVDSLMSSTDWQTALPVPEATVESEATPLSATPVSEAIPVSEATPISEAPLMPEPVDLSPYFEFFHPSQDLLAQPDPERNIAGAALAAQLISELGLAHRLRQLHSRWSGHRQSKLKNKQQSENFFKEVNVLRDLDAQGQCTPWGPLSDWLFEFELSLEAFDDEHTATPGGAMNQMLLRKRAFDKKALALRCCRLLEEQIAQLEKQFKAALAQVLVELTGENEQAIKEALEKQLAAMYLDVERDCHINGYLPLKVGRRGTYAAKK
ncbi:hypothetical protein E8E13_001046 [Curvularia kusanoi]|uniref:Uncharacterized protein n=1 Tax=Curvularia kusanoi TaxID=90978 RepID=A0A9P4T4Y2_CURKU|nr:hypothetical protein E8E13_001046 [Curvularia kusanoi]